MKMSLKLYFGGRPILQHPNLFKTSACFLGNCDELCCVTLHCVNGQVCYASAAMFYLLCFISYVLSAMLYPLCFILYALFTMLYLLCFICYDLSTMLYLLSFIVYALSALLSALIYMICLFQLFKL